MTKKATIIATSLLIVVGACTKAEEQGQASAKEQGQASAEELQTWFERGRTYAQGEGVERDATEAMRWYRKAAEQGHAEAQFRLGEAYNQCHGRYASSDGHNRYYNAEVMLWYRKAAEQGHAEAQFRLGNVFNRSTKLRTSVAISFQCLSPNAPSPNDIESTRWYRKAAEQEHAEAQFWLGEAYRSGKGVVRNDAEAMSFYRKAAEQGQADAQLKLGEAYRLGHLGLRRNDIEAYIWYSVAEARDKDGFRGDRSLNELTARMTRVQIREAQERAAELYAEIEAGKGQNQN